MEFVRLAFRLFGETLSTVRGTFWLANWVGLLIVYAALVRLVQAPLLRLIGSVFIFLVPMASHVPCIPMAARYGFGFLPMLFWPVNESSKPVLAGLACALSFFVSQESGVACIAATAFVFMSNRDKVLTRQFVAGLAAAMAVGFGYLFFTSGIGPYLKCAFPGIAGLVADQSLSLPKISLSGWSWSRAADTAAAYLPLVLYPLCLLSGKKKPLLFGLALFGVLMLPSAWGRSDRWHIYISISPMILTGALAVQQLMDRKSPRAETALLVFIVCGALLFVPHYFGFRAKEKRDEKKLQASDLLRMGRARLPFAQANAYEVLRRWAEARTRAGEPVLFYPYDGVFYFLVDRPNPSRIPILSYASRPEQQQEVIEELEKGGVEWVVWDTENRFFDGKPLSEYLSKIEAYLREAYIPTETNGPFLFLRRKNVRQILTEY